MPKLSPSGGTYEKDLTKHWYRKTNLGRGMIICGSVEVRENTIFEILELLRHRVGKERSQGE